MIDQELIDYVSRYMSGGQSLERLMADLRSRGWSDSDSVYAIDWVAAHQNSLYDAKRVHESMMEKLAEREQGATFFGNGTGTEQSAAFTSSPASSSSWEGSLYDSDRLSNHVTTAPSSEMYSSSIAITPHSWTSVHQVGRRLAAGKSLKVILAIGIVIVVFGSVFAFSALRGTEGDNGCGTNIDCFINASRVCVSTNVTTRTRFAHFGVQVNITLFCEILGMGWGSSGCAFYVDVLEQEGGGGLVELEGRNATCTFMNVSDLTALLINVRDDTSLGRDLSCDFMGGRLKCGLSAETCEGTLAIKK